MTIAGQCYYTVVRDALSFRPLTPGDYSDYGALPPVRPCPHPAVSVLASDVKVCAGHREMALDVRAAHRERRE